MMGAEKMDDRASPASAPAIAEATAPKNVFMTKEMSTPTSAPHAKAAVMTHAGSGS